MNSGHVSTAKGLGRVLNVDDPPETFGGTALSYEQIFIDSASFKA
jgi:hypothetical protein